MDECTSTSRKQGLLPQEALQEIFNLTPKKRIGIPKEAQPETRLALTPEAVSFLTGMGFCITVEKDAGLGISYSDYRYAEAGARIVPTHEEVMKNDIILKMLPPTLAEVKMIRPRSLLFSLVQFKDFSKVAYEAMIRKNIDAIGYELMMDDEGVYPLMNAISEIEGTTSIAIASYLLSNAEHGKGVLLGSIPGIAPTEVLIIGAGVAGTNAARIALGMGALVKVFDNDINRLRTIQQVLGQNVYTSNFHPQVLSKAFRSADVVIGALRIINVSNHYIISEELVQEMKKGALIIDLRVNQGACFETTEAAFSSKHEIYEHCGVLHYCVPSISRMVARTASMAFSNVLVESVLSLSNTCSVQAALGCNSRLRNGMYLFKGTPVNDYVSSRFDTISTDIGLFLSAF